MTWKSFHNRGETLRSVIATANTRHDGRLPMDVAGVAETFGPEHAGELDLLGALQLKWHTRLAGHIERALMDQPFDLPGAVVTAWGNAYDELPGVRAVLDHYRDEPLDDAMAGAMAKAAVKERALMATMAGQAGVGQEAAAARIGARIEERARTRHAALPTITIQSHRGPSLVQRLKSALAPA